MMEILFRGKRIDNGEWIEGDFISSSAYADRAWITESKTFFDREICGIRVCEVDPSTIGQYIGLKDENGKMIFDGDVVSVVYMAGTTHEKKVKGPVVYGVKESSFYVDTKYFGYGIYDMSPKVIGNIHDTPELLEKKEDKHEAD